MANQEAVDIARKIKDPQKAAKQLATEALNRDSKDDISCIVVRFKGWKKGTHILSKFRVYIFYISRCNSMLMKSIINLEFPAKIGFAPSLHM